MKKLIATVAIAAASVVTPAIVAAPAAQAAPSSAPVQARGPVHTPLIPNYCYLYRDQWGGMHWVCIR